MNKFTDELNEKNKYNYNDTTVLDIFKMMEALIKDGKSDYTVTSYVFNVSNQANVDDISKEIEI